MADKIIFLKAMGLFNTKDYYFNKAKTAGFKASSVFKLEEIDRALKIIQANSVVIDLGCSPGSWLQYVAQKIGRQGAALGIDLTEVKEKFHIRYMGRPPLSTDRLKMVPDGNNTAPERESDSLTWFFCPQRENQGGVGTKHSS